jgi:GTPase Era involved in 16S rRNA processing
MVSTRQEINVAIIGPVSAGKSTLMNSLFVSQFSDMKIKRTTMTPQLYMESDETTVDIAIMNSIKEQNKAINDAIIAKSEANEAITLADIEECRYLVPKVHKLIELINGVYLTVYDIPGLNDSRTKDVFYEYMHSHFHNFDLIIFVIDINSALNTSDEIDMLNMILNNCKENNEKHGINNRMIVLLNKCDELYINDKGHVCLDDEYAEMYEQAKTTISQKVAEIIPELDYKVLPISCEDSYIYRMYDRNPDFNLDVKHVNKFGVNEFGKKPWNRFNEATKKEKIRSLMGEMDLDETLKLTGFNRFRAVLSNYLTTEGQFDYLLNHINYDTSKINLPDTVETADIAAISHTTAINIYHRLVELYSLFGKDLAFDDNTFIIKYLRHYYDNIYSQYINTVSDDNIEIVLKIKEQLTVCRTEMPAINSLADYIKGINEAIDTYYLENIKKNEKPLSKLFDYIKKLFSGFTNKSAELTSVDMISLFSNNDEMVKVSNDRTIQRLEYLEAQGCINKVDKVAILKSVLVKRYKNVFNNVEFVANGGCTSKYIFTAMMFWNSKANASFDLFKDSVFELTYWANIAFKNMLAVETKIAEFNVDKALELEYYLFNLCC